MRRITSIITEYCNTFEGEGIMRYARAIGWLIIVPLVIVAPAVYWLGARITDNGVETTATVISIFIGCMVAVLPILIQYHRSASEI